MEPTQDKVKYAIYAKVEDVSSKVEVARTTKGGAQDKKNLGWFVHFEGSHESLFFGHTRPDFTIGDVVKITFERTSDA